MHSSLTCSNQLGATCHVEEDVFAEIISMCRDRIQCRFRLRKKSRGPYGRKKRKAPGLSAKDILQIVLEHVPDLEENESKKTKTLSLVQSDLFIEKVKEIMRLLDAWKESQTDSQLGSLVMTVYRLRRAGHTTDLISRINNRFLNPGLKSYLIDMIDKVARYREAARFLYLTAKKFPLTRQMRPVIVELPRESFGRVPTEGQNPTLQQVLSTRPQLVEYREEVPQICRLLGVSEQKANEDLTLQTRRTLKKAKIHAEVQLIYYCELNSSTIRLPPRVVRSSKDPCWLCNEFIRSHGKIHRSQSHGKLYPAWRLPLLPKPIFNGIAIAFNQSLQNGIKEGIRRLIKGKK